jgi:hypothetical protein
MFDFTILEAFLAICVSLTVIVPVHILASAIVHEKGDTTE